VKVILESTDKIIDLVTPSGTVPARIWEGYTDSGIPCHALITRIAVHRDLDAFAFERELQDTRPVSKDVSGIYDLRMVL
jgi:hypothetical protein